jgi:pyruvate,water dikinase
VDDIVQQVSYRLRRIVAAAGDWLVGAGLLAQRGDVLFLTRAECLAALESRAAAPAPLHSLVRQRQAEPGPAGSWMPPPVLGHEGAATPDPADAWWQGTAGAPGRVRGPVRVVHTLRDAAAARPGEIVVARLVTSQWAPGLPLVAGFVAEGGEPYAPGVLTAAEFGVPAVVGMAGATRHLHSGDWIEVDGRSGTVRRLDA